MDNENIIPEQAIIPEQKNAFSFRKSLGGFNKEDVISFISEENRKFNEEKEALNLKISEEIARADAADDKATVMQLSYEMLSKKTAEELAEKDAIVESANARAAKAEEAEGALKAKIAELTAALEEASSKASQNDDKIASLEAKCAELEDKCALYKDKCSQLSSELEVEKADKARLMTEKDEAIEKISEAEAKIDALSERDIPEAAEEAEAEEAEKVPDEPDEDIPSPANLREYARQGGERDGEGDNIGEAQSTQTVAEKAIETIRTINSDVKEYLSDCVGEFDSCSQDITGSISKLLDEIAERCRLLDEKLRSQRNVVSKNIEESFGEFVKKLGK